MQKIDLELNELLKKSLQGTQALANQTLIGDGKYHRVLFGIYRVSFTTLNDIHCLSTFEGTGSGMLDLTRKIIEYGVAVEYMNLHDKEKMAAQFQDFFWVESRREIDFFQSAGQGPDLWPEDLVAGAKDAENRFNQLPTELKKSNSWAGKDKKDRNKDIGCSKMLRELKAAGKLNEFNVSRLMRAYIIGCRHNHPSPFSVVSYLSPSDYAIANLDCSRKAICMSICMHIQITRRYLEEIRLVKPGAHMDIEISINEVFNDLEISLANFEASGGNKI